MKRICLMVVLFVNVFTSISLADSSIVEYTSPYINQRWVCEMFDTQMNVDAQAAFTHRLLPDDQIICGAEMLYYDHRHLDEPFVKDILMAVKREESILTAPATLEYSQDDQVFYEACFVKAFEWNDDCESYERY